MLQGNEAVRSYDDTTPEALALGCPGEPKELPRQPEVAGCAPEGEYTNVDEASDEEIEPAEPEITAPEDTLAVSMALSAELIAEFPACAVIKGGDIVECRRCDQPTVRPRLHG